LWNTNTQFSRTTQSVPIKDFANVLPFPISSIRNWI